MAALNTADKFDPELPLIRSKAHGGTMVLWKQKYDPYVLQHPVISTAFLPVIFQPPGSSASIHIAVYLPTLGQESLFLEEISKLSVTIEELKEIYPGTPIYIRGDLNVSNSNLKRTSVLNHFCSEYDFREVFLPSPTYHHFVGYGKSDSYLDKILFSGSVEHQETLKHTECSLSNPLVNSHHDLLVSEIVIPDIETEDTTTAENIVAPTIENNRVKVIWSDDGKRQYQDLVAPHLSRLQELWLSSSSRTSISLLLESTNNLLIYCAAKSNRTVALNSKPALFGLMSFIIEPGILLTPSLW